MSKKKQADSAKKNGADEEPATRIELELEHHVLAVSQFANHLVVSADSDSVFLSFFQMSPPFVAVMGSESHEEKTEALRKAGKIIAEGVARVVIPKSKLLPIIEAMQKTAAALVEGKKIEIQGK